jgi:group I intron endonuclease
MGKPIIGVYKITNTLCPEGKYYIGYSCNVKQRWQKHKSTLRCGSHCNILMQRAYEKYGSEWFDYEILQECENEEEAKNVELSYLEDKTIRDKLYNLHYNSSGGDMLTFHPDRKQIIEKRVKEQKEQISKMTKEERHERWGQPGVKNGMYGRTHTDEVKRLYSEMHKGNTYRLGKKASQETKEKMSVIASERLGEKNPFFGKHHSEETKQKVRETKQKNREKNGPTIPKNARKVLIDGETYITVTEAGRQLGICAGTILHRIKSPNPLYVNYFYVENEPKHNTSISAETRQKMCEARNKRESPNSKPVVIDGIQYKSTSEASRQLGVSTGIIRNRLKSNIPINEPPKKRESPMSKKVIIDDILYKSTAEASRQLGISKSIIGNRLYNKFQIFDNYKFADTKTDEVMLPLPSLSEDDVCNQ